MKIYETIKNEFIISTDKSKLDVDTIHNYLCHESYWAKNIPVELVKKSIVGSCCFGLFVKENTVLKQIGFARVISDFATFGYLADVFILDAYRVKGLSKCPPVQNSTFGRGSWKPLCIVPICRDCEGGYWPQKMHMACIQNLVFCHWINRNALWVLSPLKNTPKNNS